MNYPCTPFTRQLFSIGLTITAITSSIVSFTPVAQARLCRTIAQDWDGLVDVRSAPNFNIFNLIATLPNGIRLDVIGQRGDWLEIYVPDNRLGANYQTGWVAQKQTRRVCFRDDRPSHY